MGTVNLVALEAHCAAFVAAVPPPRPTPEPVTAALQPWAGHAIDGKAVRGATRPGATVHLVSLVRHDDGRVWGQVAVADKSNEITAAPRLLVRRNLHGTVTTMDALLTQRTLAPTHWRRAANI